MKLAYLAALAAIAVATPSYAATATTLETRSGTVTSPIPDLTLSDSKGSLLNLSNGTYLLSLAFFGNTGAASSEIWKYSTAGTILESVQWLAAVPGDNVASGFFDIVNTPGSFYVWKSAVYAAGGTSSYTTSIQSVAAVPGPEAGVGLGALAMGGIALYVKRRRKEENLAA